MTIPQPLPGDSLPDVDLEALYAVGLKRVVNREGYRMPRPHPTLRPTEASVSFDVTPASGGPPISIVEGTCGRKVWYRLKKYPKVEPVREDSIEVIRECGQWFEEFSNEVLKEAGAFAGKKFQFKDRTLPLEVSGEIDTVGQYTDAEGNRKYFFIDWKTTGQYHNQKGIFGNKSLEPFPKVENLLQIMVYLHQDRSIEFGKLYYGVRDRWERTQFTVRLKAHERTGKTVANITRMVRSGGVAWTPQTTTTQNFVQYNIEEIYRRYALVCDAYFRDEPPPRDFQLEYTDERLEEMAELGLVSETAYKAHKKGKDLAGDQACRWCEYAHVCWPRAQGSGKSPGLEAPEGGSNDEGLG